MENELRVTGQQEFLGVDIPVVVGGFGNNSKVVMAKTVAEIHRVEVKYINKLINNNKTRFKDGVDLIDLKTGSSKELVLSMGFTNAQYGNAKNIYTLSERGYAKLIKIMDTDLAWEVHDKMMDEYFAMREVIQTQPSLQDQLRLKLFSKDPLDVVTAHQKLVEIEVGEATKPLIHKIEEQEPMVKAAEMITKVNNEISMEKMAKILQADYGINIGRTRLFEFLRGKAILQKNNIPYQRYCKHFRVVSSFNKFTGDMVFTTLVRGEGVMWLAKLVQKEYNK